MRPLIAVAVVLATISPISSFAQHTVDIIDDSPYKPAPSTTKNVGQEIKLRAVTTGPGTPTYYDWRVYGEVVADYNEMEPLPGMPPFSITDIVEVTPGQWDVGGAAMDKIEFIWREAGAVLPAARKVHVVCVWEAPNADLILKEVTFTVERNTMAIDRQAEDYYVTNNHKGRVRIEHRDWHAGNKFWLAGYNGAEFFQFHRRFIGRYDAWRVQFGYPPVGTYNPAGAIPAADGAYSIAHADRASEDPGLPMPPWFTFAGDGSARPMGEPACAVGGQMKRRDFANLAELGCAVTSPWHNDVHVAIGGSGPSAGSMGKTFTAPEDPVFWRWHRFVNTIADDYLDDRANTPGIPPNLASANPPVGYGLASLTTISVDFAEPVTGVVAADLEVDGSPATTVSGSGSGPYVFTGFSEPGAGPVGVELGPGSIIDVNDGMSMPGAETWTYTISTCVDADGDGVYEDQCWPSPSFDNCPSVFNPDQADEDDDEIGDACEGSTGIGDGDVPPALSKILSVAPNPFGASALVRFDLSSDRGVRMEVFDLQGRKIAVLVDRWMAAGNHRYEWNGKDSGGVSVPSGIYFLRLTAGATRDVAKLVVLR